MKTNEIVHLLAQPLRIQRQQGSILVPVLIVAIIVVLVLMWQAGMFSSAPSTPSTANNLQPDTASSQTNADSPDAINEASTAAAPAPLEAPGPDASPSEIAQYRAANFVPQVERTADSESKSANAKPMMSETQTAAAIDEAATLLITNNTPDFSACRSETNAELALQCAASKQSKALQNAFRTHNEQRHSGDDFVITNSTAIMTKVVENLQNKLTPFVEAADGAAAIIDR